jgi:hypothetical protein
MSLNRARTGPVMPDPSGFFVTGTVMVSAPGRSPRSPCQPLDRMMSPRVKKNPSPRSSPTWKVPMRFRLPRLDTVNVATYSTMPWALRAAKSMSVMIALRASRGSSSPNARPVIRSYGPAAPKDCSS